MNAFMDGRAAVALNRASLVLGVLAMAGTLALLVYVPEDNKAWNMALTVLALGSFCVHLFTLNGLTISLGVSLLLCFGSLNLLIPHFSVDQASQNLGGVAPAITQQASQLLRESPLNAWRAFQVIQPLAWRDSSYSAADVDLFRSAQAMGLQSEEINRVLANGFVQGKDRKQLIVTLLKAQQAANPGAVGLLAKLAK